MNYSGATLPIMTEVLQLPAVPDPPPAHKYAYVHFRHPYNGRKFLALPKVDIVRNASTNDERRSLHSNTALYACHVIARNKPGFFSVDRARDRAIAAKLDADYLDVDKVFYHLDDETAAPRYSICTEFRHWKFPHPDSETLSDWKAVLYKVIPMQPPTRSRMSYAVKNRDKSCRTTRETAALDTCYMVPKAEFVWFIDNDMEQHCRDEINEVEDDLNAIALRTDIRRLFDDGAFVCSPKDGAMRLHFLDAVYIGSYIQHQNSYFLTDNIAFEFLYARFAWAVFKHLVPVMLGVGFHDDGKPKGEDDDDEYDDPGTKGDEGDPEGSKSRYKRSRRAKQPDLEFSRVKHHSTDPRGSKEDRLRRQFPFFYDPEATASPYTYETLPWYPERKQVEERKERWFVEHPNIREVEGTEFADTSTIGDSD